MRISVSTVDTQKGAALLAFMLVLIVASTYYLVTKLNANLQIAAGEQQTREALDMARQALIGYAVSYPDQINAAEGPGYLPCPDTDKDGDAEGNCSIASNTIIGRLPYKTLEISRLRDSSGQELWYALSENFRYGPNKLIPLNSESPASAELFINNTGDIVTVIIAPGEPLNSQNRDPAEIDHLAEIANYLDGDNADLDTAFVTRAAGDFNDVITVITRTDLMRAVEKRVLGEAARILAEYEGIYGAYPWLTPFADPKAEFRIIEGTHDGSNGAPGLVDSTRDFTLWGVAAGDVVRNMTDGSVGTINSVTATTLGFSGGMQMGMDNDFDDGDEYVVTVGSLAISLSGTADGGSAGNVLVDGNADFNELGIAAGDIVENLSDVSGTTWASGMVESVDSTTELTVKSLSGGTVNVFSAGDDYLIRSNQGQASGGSSNLTLVDPDKNFSIMGILPGDSIVNYSDGSFGRVSAVIDEQTLTVNNLYSGDINTFTPGDNYAIPRFNTDSVTREGLLSFHREGEMFPTGFNMSFTISADSSDVNFDTATFPDTDSTYRTALENHVINYFSNGSVSFDASASACVWMAREVADCRGSFDDYVNISGRVTSGNNTNVVTDSAADYNVDGVKRGDIVQNFDDESFVSSGTADADSSGTTLVDSGTDFSIYDPYSHVIQNDTQEGDEGVPKIQGVISRVIDTNTIEVEPYLGEGTITIDFDPGDNFTIYKPQKMVVRSVNSSTSLDSTKIISTDPDFDDGEYYRVIPAAGSIDGTVDSTSPSPCTAGSTCQITDAGGDFLNIGIAVGDIIENVSDIPQSFGEITDVTETTITTVLYGGGTNIFAPVEQYRIYFNHVYFRRHEFHPRIRGSMASDNLSGKRVRDVCVGYNADCTSVSGSVSFSGNGGVPLLTVRDYKEDGSAEVGRATFQPSNASSGTMKVSDIDYYFAVNSGDIPEWLVDNKWHQLVSVGYSDVDKPGGVPPCTAGVDCLVLTGSGAPNDNKRSLVISAGKELAGQDRSAGNMDDYYEGENNSAGDDTYQKSAPSNTFNDQMRVIDTSP